MYISKIGQPRINRVSSRLELHPVQRSYWEYERVVRAVHIPVKREVLEYQPVRIETEYYPTVVQQREV